MHGSERSRHNDFKNYCEFRKKVPKVDVTFRDAAVRRQRVADTPQKFTHFVEGLIGLGKKAEAEEKAPIRHVIMHQPELVRTEVSEVKPTIVFMSNESDERFQSFL